MDNTVNDLNKQAWMRYMARTIDVTIGSIFIGLSLGFFLALSTPPAVFETLPFFLLGSVVVFLYLLIEAWIIATYKATPAKKLLGITVTDSSGAKLSYAKSLKRDLYMWAAGLGLSLPLISLIAMLLSYTKYTEKGITPWDEAYDIKVNFEPISNARFITAVIVTVAVIVLNVYFY